MLNFISNIFGSSNDRILKKMMVHVNAANELEEELSSKPDSFFIDLKDSLQKQYQDNNQDIYSILPLAFAAVREASKRTLGLRHFDSQMLGGISLAEGNIAEMKTGEGKTLVATLPAYLNSAIGNKAVLVTVNDYLAKRDAEWMRPIYEFLGLSVGVVNSNQDIKEKTASYKCDVIYATNNELGFDYLRDNMAPNLNSETSNNFDITFNFDNGDFYAYASFYITDVDNYIALIDEEDDHMDEEEHHEDEDDHHEEEGEHHEDDHDDHGHGNLIHANYMQEDAEFDGYEIEFGRSFDLGSGELALSFGRDVVNAEFADGHYVPRINPARNIYSLVYTQDDLLFKLMLKDVEKQNDIGEGETATDAYQMLNTRLTKTFNGMGEGELKVSLFANNLLDEVARNHSSFVKNEVPLPGRNYGLKFNLTF